MVNLDSSLNSIENVASVNWPNPDDHWSDIPLDRLDNWKQWGRSDQEDQDVQNKDGVYKRKVENYLPYSYQAPTSSKSGFYTDDSQKSQFPQAQQPQQHNSFSPPSPQQFSVHNQLPPTASNSFQRFTSPTPRSEARQNNFFSSSQSPIPPPPEYNSGFFPSNLLVEYPNTPILNHPETETSINNLQPHYVPAPPPQNQTPYQAPRFIRERQPETQKHGQYLQGQFKPFRNPVPVKAFGKNFNLQENVDQEPKHPSQNLFSEFNVHPENLHAADIATQRKSYQNVQNQRHYQPPSFGRNNPRPYGLGLNKNPQSQPQPPFRQNLPKRFPNRPRRKVLPPRYPNNQVRSIFGFQTPTSPPHMRRNNGRNHWKSRNQDNHPNNIQEEIESQEFEETKETEEDESDSFSDADFFKDPDFENFDFSDFEEFDIYDYPEEKNSSKNDSLKQLLTDRLENEADVYDAENEPGPDNMDFNYSREGLEMYKESHQNKNIYENNNDKIEYQNQNEFESKDVDLVQYPSSQNTFESENEGFQYPSKEDFSNLNNVFDSNFVFNEEKKSENNKEQSNNVPNYNEDYDNDIEQHLEYEGKSHNKDPFRHFSYGPSEDNDFAEFDKYFNDFENEHTNLREGRESSNDLVPIHEMTNKEESNTLNVITEPFDTSDIQSSDKE